MPRTERSSPKGALNVAGATVLKASQLRHLQDMTPGYVPALDPVSVQQLKLARTSYRTHEKKKYMKQFDAARQKAKAFSASVDPQRLQEIEADLEVHADRSEMARNLRSILAGAKACNHWPAQIKQKHQEQKRIEDEDFAIQQEATMRLVHAQEVETQKHMKRQQAAQAVQADTAAELHRRAEARAIREEREYAEGQLIQAAAKKHLHDEQLKKAAARDRRLQVSREVRVFNEQAKAHRDAQAQEEAAMDHHFAMLAAVQAIEEEQRLVQAAKAKEDANKRFYAEKAVFEKQSAVRAVVDSSRDREHSERLELQARAKALEKCKKRAAATQQALQFNAGLMREQQQRQEEEAQLEGQYNAMAAERAALAAAAEDAKCARREQARQEHLQVLAKQKEEALEQRELMRLGPYKAREQLAIRAQAHTNIAERQRQAALKKLRAMGAHPKYIKAAQTLR